ncbi:pyridoxamine 5'-phosphate oxidase [Helicobacter sp. MIT 11-5569]|uniref:pyridoxamine 5'-phosphate oxidase family protein n=1 Tax=Helicobacter sp. MIT 11-5569 TaxID=1548151 RepID=UPI00051FED11|nr:pyridoxamine 5'-phosphate oxidase family protein [Helicobacter sp. MIT 11-5569]TLD81391.1 pyridoxamine 5'-phosphate oxidase [Helicobacter sp. MIT 11-5569]
MTQEVLEFLDNHVGFLATKGTCGNPRVRPMQSPLYYEGKLYVCTSKKKGICKHIQNFSGIELSAFDGKETWIRIRAEAVFDEDIEVKKKMFEKYAVVREIYKSPDNPDFAVFYFKNPSVKIQSFSGRDEVIKG